MQDRLPERSVFDNKTVFHEEAKEEVTPKTTNEVIALDKLSEASVFFSLINDSSIIVVNFRAQVSRGNYPLEGLLCSSSLSTCLSCLFNELPLHGERKTDISTSFPLKKRGWASRVDWIDCWTSLIFHPRGKRPLSLESGREEGTFWWRRKKDDRSRQRRRSEQDILQK